MPVVYLTRKASFSASHRMHNPELSDQENLEIYGKCNNPNGHGHNYTLEVTVKGEIDLRTGMVMSLSDLKRVIKEAIIEPLDHRNLNLDVPVMQGINPTAENLVVVFWNQLEQRLPAGALVEIKLHETENNLVTYRGH
jgi:6-pyruvoyltetrahydropterin/6-carboxytetrahydropterin synthase